MGLLELILLAIGLSMDAFAVAVCKGLNMTRLRWKNCFVIALFFGGFQGLMPLIGWLLGTQFRSVITGFDHWVAFGLLAVIGGKMILEAFSKAPGDKRCADRIALRELLVLAVATSVDALAVGITFALLPRANILLSVLLIGSITFVLSFAGVFIGNKFGSRYEKKAELTGGILLVAIGLKILLEHLQLF